MGLYSAFKKALEAVGLSKEETLASIPRIPISLDFTRDWHKYMLNWEELGAQIVNLSDEGISPPWDWGEDKALKISVGANEVKYLRIPLTVGHQGITYAMWTYLTGTVTLEHQGTWVGTNPVVNVQDEWVVIFARAHSEGIAVKIDGGASGGNVYVYLIDLYRVSEDNEFPQGVDGAPNQALDGSTTYEYLVSFIISKDAIDYQLRTTVYIAGDGTNSCDVDIYLQTIDGLKLVASISRTADTFAWINKYFPVRANTQQSNIPFIYMKYVVSGYGTFKKYGTRLKPFKEHIYLLNGKKTASASNTSTTVTKYTLVDNDGRANRYKQASVSLDSPADGTAILYINGKQVADFSGSSGTFNIPEDLDVWKIEVDLAGDGTTAATADFEGLELLGPYIMQR